MSNEAFADFYLVGGTALALQIGHRKSIDIDLFGNTELDELSFLEILSNWGKIEILKKSRNILIYLINGIKLDFVNYRYPWLQEPLILEGIRFASKPDILAMKLNAISGRGSKKDFIDLYFLLKEFSIKEALSFYNKKYQDGSSFLVRKSLSYFVDADAEPSPLMFNDVSWDEVKSSIRTAIIDLEKFKGKERQCISLIPKPSLNHFCLNPDVCPVRTGFDL